MEWILGPLLLWFCAWLFSLFVGWFWAIGILVGIAAIIAIAQIFAPSGVGYSTSKKITVIKEDGTVETWRKD